MITHVEVLGFRALRHVRVHAGSFQVLVGPNATGKSAFLDVLGLLRDILTVGLSRAVFGDSRADVAPRASDPRDLGWLRRGAPVEIALTAELPQGIASRVGKSALRYELGLGTDPLSYQTETLWLVGSGAANAGREAQAAQRELFPVESAVPETIVCGPRKKAPAGWRKVINKISASGNDYFASETSGWNNQFRLGPNKSALGNLPEDEEKFPASIWFKRFLMEGVYRIALNAEAMRLPAPAGSPTQLLSDGSNLPWAVHALWESDPQRLADWTAHVRTALPDLRSIGTVEKPEDRSRYLQLTYDSGLSAPAWLLSDGTLRLLALTLLAYLPRNPSVLLIEEPENGIHPKAVEVVVQSLQSVYDSQVWCATHSPLVVSLVEPRDLLCFGKAPSGSVDIVSGDAHPALREWKTALHLGDLFAAGVLG